MSFANDLAVLYHLAFAPIRGQDHRERLESFYAGQARGYDAFRAHLLHGRRELYERIPIPKGGVWVEMGGGTGAALEFLGPRIAELASVHIVDLSQSLLDIARKRAERHGWTNVSFWQEDATAFDLPLSVMRSGERRADVVTFSYSLTMIPDWFAAVDNARQLLKPGGLLAAVDFFVARKYPAAGHQRHSWWTRTFWPAWLGLDNVVPSPDHIPYLRRRFQTMHFAEHWARMKYFPLFRVPYYQFLGVKPVQ
ncbi:MAG: class I SAM-dependent methyltransferase [Gemmataceae bacterium]|nr:class I SAM-dependent methyltransferase [Gemmataceae bacterium]